MAPKESVNNNKIKKRIIMKLKYFITKIMFINIQTKSTSKKSGKMFGTNIKVNNLIFYISLELNVKSFLDHNGEKNGN